jgi:hypothetical protein
MITFSLISFSPFYLNKNPFSIIRAYYFREFSTKKPNIHWICIHMQQTNVYTKTNAICRLSSQNFHDNTIRILNRRTWFCKHTRSLSLEESHCQKYIFYEKKLALYLKIYVKNIWDTHRKEWEDEKEKAWRCKTKTERREYGWLPHPVIKHLVYCTHSYVISYPPAVHSINLLVIINKHNVSPCLKSSINNPSYSLQLQTTLQEFTPNANVNKHPDYYCIWRIYPWYKNTFTYQE